MIGVVIINYKTWEITVECVNSIKVTCKNPYHIYIVDNKSPNNSVKMLRDTYYTDKTITIIESPINGGYGYGLNRGFEAALNDNCDAVISSNNDILYTENSIERLYKVLKSDNRIAVVGAQQFTPQGVKQPSAVKRAYGRFSFMFWYFPFRYHLSFIRRIEDYIIMNSKKNVKIAFPIGGCYMINIEVLKYGMLYDEKMFMYSEEDVVGYKIRKQNKIAVLCPNAHVIHKHGATTGRNVAKYILASAPNKVYFCKEYLKMNSFELTLHKVLFKFSVNIKSLRNQQYKNLKTELLSLFD